MGSRPAAAQRQPLLPDLTSRHRCLRHPQTGRESDQVAPDQPPGLITTHDKGVRPGSVHLPGQMLLSFFLGFWSCKGLPCSDQAGRTFPETSDLPALCPDKRVPCQPDHPRRAVDQSSENDEQ